MNQFSCKKLPLLLSSVLGKRKKAIKHLRIHSVVFLLFLGVFLPNTSLASLFIPSELEPYECYMVRLGFSGVYDTPYLPKTTPVYTLFEIGDNSYVTSEYELAGNMPIWTRVVGGTDGRGLGRFFGWDGEEWSVLHNTDTYYFDRSAYWDLLDFAEKSIGNYTTDPNPYYQHPCGCPSDKPGGGLGFDVSRGVCIECEEELEVTEFKVRTFSLSDEHWFYDKSPSSIWFEHEVTRSGLPVKYNWSDGYSFQITIVDQPETIAPQQLPVDDSSWSGTYLSGSKEGKLMNPGRYSVTIRVLDNNDCEATKTIDPVIVTLRDPIGCIISVDFGSSANVTNGNLSHSQELFSTSGSGLTSNLSLYYNSTDPYEGPLGIGWNYSYGISLTEQQIGDVMLRTGTGVRSLFMLVDGLYISPKGDYSILTKNSDNSFTLTKKDGREYLFSADGLLQSITDRNSNRMEFSYYNNLLASTTNSAGQLTTFAYNVDGKLTAITGPDGKIYTFEVVDEMLAGIIYPDTGRWDYIYDDHGFILSKIDPAGYATSYTYDDEHRVKTSTDPEGKVRTLNYPSDEESDVLTTELVEKDGTVWQYNYNPYNSDLVSKVDAAGNVTSFTYDDEDNKLSETDPEGNASSYTYDAVGNRTSVTDPTGATTTYNYNDYGQTISIKDAQGDTTSYTYDDRGNQTAVTDPVGNITKYQYDSQGRITSITNPVGQTSAMTYDAYGNIATMTDASGNITTFSYDSSGNMVSQKDSLGNVTTFEYDNSGNMVKVIDPQGNVSTYSYDANGNRIATTDANGNTTYSTYNYKGQVISTTDALGNVTTYNYGSSGCSSCSASPDKLTSLTDANGNTTTFVYDALGRLEKEINPLGKATSYTYDTGGNMTSRTDANGNTIRYSYDILGRLLTKTYPDKTVTSFTYDVKGNMLTAANRDIAYAMQYDKLGRMTMVTDSTGKTISSAYNVLGNRTSMTTPNGKTITYGYDSNNRLGGINSWAGNITFAYDDLGRRISLNYPNKVTTTYDYDQLGNLTRLMARNSKDQIVAAFTYDHDQVGNRLSKAMPDKRYDYDYDAIYRLLEASPVRINKKGKEIEDKHNTEGFSYDPVGNRLSGPEWKDSYAYDNGNQLLDSRKYDYQYDSNGNLISKIEFDDDRTSWTYEYDYENRLVRAIKIKEDETKIVSFKYDPFNRRIEKKDEEIEEDAVEAKTFTYVYDGANLILEIETGGDGKGKEKANRYVYGLGTSEPVAIEQKGEVYYYHLDGLNTPTALTDQKGKVVVSYEYSAFGERKHYGNRVKQYLTFPGQYYDEETGLHYNWNRYYDPSAGRYITPDPIGLKGGLNLFLYVDGNPVNEIDPEGLQKIYGNWCGPDWTGGYDKSWDQLTEQEKQTAQSPVDDLDSCCETHDKCYATCRDNFPCLGEDRAMCFRACDINLNMCPGTKNVSDPRGYLVIKYMQNSDPGPGDDNSMCCAN